MTVPALSIGRAHQPYKQRYTIDNAQLAIESLESQVTALQCEVDALTHYRQRFEAQIAELQDFMTLRKVIAEVEEIVTAKKQQQGETQHG